jgi:hypothetical protein
VGRCLGAAWAPRGPARAPPNRLAPRPHPSAPPRRGRQALRAAEKVFGADVNSKGFKDLRGVGVIQGDGINIVTLKVPGAPGGGQPGGRQPGGGRRGGRGQPGGWCARWQSTALGGRKPQVAKLVLVFYV